VPRFIDPWVNITVAVSIPIAGVPLIVSYDFASEVMHAIMLSLIFCGRKRLRPLMRFCDVT
jgi:hypothetical protein